jgi:integrase
MPKTEKAVRLRKNVKVAGKWRWCPLATDSKGRLVGDVVLVKGRRETRREGRFAVFWKEAGKNRSEPAGTDFIEARAALRRRQARLNAQLAGVAMPAEPAGRDRVRLEDAADDFLAEVRTQRERKTFLAYRSMLRDFLESCAKAHLDELERPDLIEFVAYLKAKPRGKSSKGLSDRTVYNKFELLMSFLKSAGIRGLATRRDWPKYTEQDVEVYEREELTTLFERCNDRERILFKFFLSSAGRDREVIFTAWPNLDLKNALWHVKAKPNLGFKPKDYEERTVPLPDSIVEELRKWRKRAGNTFLVFPGSDGKPDTHMLRTLKQLALVSGLNCGHCRSAKGLSCRKHPVCDRWYLHKFRATTATNWLQNDVDIKTVQAWLGHSDMESTLRYLKAASARKPIVREKVNTAFAGLAT